MPSLHSRARRRALTFSHSLANIIRRKLPCSLFSKSRRRTEKPLPDLPSQPSAISHPRHLRRTHGSVSHYSRRHFIEQLPVEIIAHIFVLGSIDDPSFPVAVSHVCRAWRYIAIRTPALWRQIRLSPNESMWRERIRRARACSLDVQLLPWIKSRSGARRSLELTPYTVQWYMHIVLPYIHRWRSLEIVFSEDTPFIWRAALAGCTVPASTLQELTLRYRGNDDVQDFTLFGGHAPCLQRLTVDGIRLNWLTSLFGNLTYLDYVHHGFTSGHQTVHDVLNMLSVSCRLAELRLLFPRGQLARISSRRRYVNNRVTLPGLTHLQLTVDGSDIPFELAHLVTLLDTPILSSLRLVDLGRSRHSFSSLKSFFYVYALPRSLRYIHVAHGWYDPKMIQPMANSLPLLRKIGVKRYHVQEQMLNVSRARNRTGSVNRTFGHSSSQRQYRIDHLNAQYFPLAFTEW